MKWSRTRDAGKSVATQPQLDNKIVCNIITLDKIKLILTDRLNGYNYKNINKTLHNILEDFLKYFVQN